MLQRRITTHQLGSVDRYFLPLCALFWSAWRRQEASPLEAGDLCGPACSRKVVRIHDNPPSHASELLIPRISNT